MFSSSFEPPMRFELFKKPQNGERSGKMSTNEWLHFIQSTKQKAKGVG